MLICNVLINTFIVHFFFCKLLFHFVKTKKCFSSYWQCSLGRIVNSKSASIIRNKKKTERKRRTKRAKEHSQAEGASCPTTATRGQKRRRASEEENQITHPGGHKPSLWLCSPRRGPHPTSSPLIPARLPLPMASSSSTPDQIPFVGFFAGLVVSSGSGCKVNLPAGPRPRPSVA